jgi:hypothetical protein
MTDAQINFFTDDNNDENYCSYIGILSYDDEDNYKPVIENGAIAITSGCYITSNA